MAYPRLREPVLIFLTLLLAASQVGAARANKVVVVAANRVVLSDLDDESLPTISRMLRDGAVGLISPNCAGYKNPMSVLLTAGSGSSCRGGDYVREVYDTDEVVSGDQLAGDAYSMRTGRRTETGSGVFLGLAQAQRESAIWGPVTIGLLGENLRRAGKRTCAVGNSDAVPDIIDRSAAVLAIDSDGRIDIGRLSAGGALNAHTGSLRGPPGFFSDTARLQEAALAGLASADFVVVDFGDTARLDGYKLGLSDRSYQRHRANVLRSLDSLLRRLLSAPQAHGAVVVLASFSPPSNGSWDRLTPIVIYPSPQSGLLMSSTTRTAGIIAASDFAPTVLRIIGVKPSAPAAGRAASLVMTCDKMQRLHSIDTRVTARRALLAPVMWSMAGVAGLSLTGSALVVGFPLRPRRWFLVMLRVGLLACASACAAMLLAVFAPPGIVSYVASWIGAMVLLIGISLLAGTVWSGRRERPHVPAAPVVLLYWFTVAAVLIDGAAGGKLCRFALPSSYYISGLRYYGIGNEYASALIFMGGLAVLYSRAAVRPRLAAVVGVLSVIVLGMGTMGANYGGTFAAAITFGLIWTVVRRGAFGARHAIAAFVAGAVLVCLFALLDLRLAGESVSHAGRIARTAEGMGEAGAAIIMLRKMLYNLRLTSSSNALRLYVSFTPLLVLWFWRVQGRVRELFSGDPIMLPGLRALWIGAAAAFLANDSGVVMVCVMMAMTTTILLYSLLERTEAGG